jgi:molecular chaperone DnaK
MAGASGGMPSPIGEPEPFGTDPGVEQFGTVRDLSLVSSSGLETNPGVPSSVDRGFGHVSDLSLISNVETARFDDDPTEALKRGAPAKAPVVDDGADLPAVVERADLPAVAQSRGGPKRPESRRPPSQIGAMPSGSSGMIGKPPTPVAPQPFGPMEKKVDEPPAGARTAAMPARPVPSPVAAKAAATQPSRQQPPAGGAPVRPPALGNLTAGMSARPAPPVAKPFDTTMPLERSPVAPTQLSAPQPPRPPPPPPPPFQSTAPMTQPQAFGSQPPPGHQPVFGAFSSSPPEAGYEAPGGSRPPQNFGYAAPVLVDVTPRALVVETAGGYTDTVIPRNSKIPCERTRRFATGRDMQTTVRVRVAQGEHAQFPQNTYLGEVELSGLRPAPRGEVVVAVTFEVDADGTMRVRARDVQTGQEARATLQLVGVADESSVVMMINRFAQQPVGGGSGPGPGGGAPPGYPI